MNTDQWQSASPVYLIVRLALHDFIIFTDTILVFVTSEDLLFSDYFGSLMAQLFISFLGLRALSNMAVLPPYLWRQGIKDLMERKVWEKCKKTRERGEEVNQKGKVRQRKADKDKKTNRQRHHGTGRQGELTGRTWKASVTYRSVWMMITYKKMGDE